MSIQRTRREFIRDIGISAAAAAFIGNLPSIGLRQSSSGASSGSSSCSAPNGVVPNTFWPDAEGNLADVTLKESLSPLEPFKSRMLTLHGVCDRVRGDGDAHMRGMGCLLTGVELFPGNVQGGSDTPAGWARGISIDQEIKNLPAARRRPRAPASARSNSASWSPTGPTPGRAWSTPAPIGPSRRSTIPIRCSTGSMAGCAIRRPSAACSTICAATCSGSPSAVSAEDRRLLEEHATFVREMERDLRANRDAAAHAVPQLEPNVRNENDNIPRTSRMQIDLMVNSFVSRLHPRRHAAVHQLRRQRPHDLARHHRRPSRTVAQARHRPRRPRSKLTNINKWYCEQLAYLARRLAETPEPGGTGSLLDNTLIVWTNELGKGNSHTLDNIPFVLVGNGLDFRMGRSLRYNRVPHNRLLLSLAHGMGHRIQRFGNPNFCGDGPLPNLT